MVKKGEQASRGFIIESNKRFCFGERQGDPGGGFHAGLRDFWMTIRVKLSFHQETYDVRPRLHTDVSNIWPTPPRISITVNEKRYVGKNRLNFRDSPRHSSAKSAGGPLASGVGQVVFVSAEGISVKSEPLEKFFDLKIMGSKRRKGSRGVFYQRQRAERSLEKRGLPGSTAPVCSKAVSMRRPAVRWTCHQDLTNGTG